MCQFWGLLSRRYSSVLVSPEAGYISIMLALNCLVPVRSTCPALAAAPGYFWQDRATSGLDQGRNCSWCGTGLETEGEAGPYRTPFELGHSRLLML